MSVQRAVQFLGVGTNERGDEDMDHDHDAADRNECYCEDCTDRATWYDLDR